MCHEGYLAFKLENLCLQEVFSVFTHIKIIFFVGIPCQRHKRNWGTASLSLPTASSGGNSLIFRILASGVACAMQQCGSACCTWQSYRIVSHHNMSYVDSYGNINLYHVILSGSMKHYFANLKFPQKCCPIWGIRCKLSFGVWSCSFTITRPNTWMAWVKACGLCKALQDLGSSLRNMR